MAARTQPARGASDADAPDRPSTDSADTTKKSTRSIDASGATLEDPTTKRASMEFASYNDSDHITVVTPSIALGIENTSGASLHATYLVDVVSAASVDIVSTASSRWKEVRHAGTIEAEYKPHDFGGQRGHVGVERAGLPVVRRSRERHQGLRREELDALLRLRLRPRHHRSVRRLRDAARRSASSREPSSAARSTAGSTSSSTASRSLSITGDVIIENGDQSKPYRYVPMFAPDVAPLVPKGASIDQVNQAAPPREAAGAAAALAAPARGDRRATRAGSTARRSGSKSACTTTRGASSPRPRTSRWIFDLGRRFAIWPHARFHVQNSVSFWQRAYVSGPAPGWNLPEYRTGDRELGPLWTIEGGFGLKWYLGSDDEPEHVGAAADERRDVHVVPRRPVPHEPHGGARGPGPGGAVLMRDRRAAPADDAGPRACGLRPWRWRPASRSPRASTRSHELQVQALGGEAPGVRPGRSIAPVSRASCATARRGRRRTQFVIAGTVYAVAGPERSGRLALRW